MTVLTSFSVGCLDLWTVLRLVRVKLHVTICNNVMLIKNIHVEELCDQLHGRNHYVIKPIITCMYRLHSFLRFIL